MNPPTKAQPPAVMQAMIEAVDTDLRTRVARQPLPPKLAEAVHYGVCGGGKRVRPVLALMSCEAVSGDIERARCAAAAVELIHCFSLIHDDLPALDNDELRRGQPTLHIRSGEAMAILAGDVMMSLALTWLTEDEVEDRTRSLLSNELAAATTAMIIGQVYDTLGGVDESLEQIDQLEEIHRNKTGALIRCACRMGAICGHANEAQLMAITQYGQAMGLMFQVVDDLLDVTQSTEIMGKATGKDETAGKMTYPGILGIDATRQTIEKLRQEALGALDQFGPEAEGLRDFCRFMAIRSH